MISQASISLVSFPGSAALGCISVEQGSAACELLFVSAVEFSLLFSGAHRLSGFRWVCVTSSRELRSTCFFSSGSVFGVQTDSQTFGSSKRFLPLSTVRCTRSLGHAGSTVLLAAQLSFVNFVLREEFAFLFQTFSRNALPGEAPLSRGRSVFKKKEKKKYRVKKSALLLSPLQRMGALDKRFLALVNAIIFGCLLWATEKCKLNNGFLATIRNILATCWPTFCHYNSFELF